MYVQIDIQHAVSNMQYTHKGGTPQPHSTPPPWLLTNQCYDCDCALRPALYLAPLVPPCANPKKQLTQTTSFGLAGRRGSCVAGDQANVWLPSEGGGLWLGVATPWTPYVSCLLSSCFVFFFSFSVIE